MPQTAATDWRQATRTGLSTLRWSPWPAAVSYCITYEPLIVKLQIYMAANLRREADTSSPAEGVRRHQRLLDAVLSGDRAVIGEELERHGSRRYFH